ncbi:hypothetical protein TRFO_24458 [Tritrichomonas foetus]|uniref:RRM domain-containing protein n=1 Tax=Tritrichomonas foetus TaxID=1144522 RepID=A0A1J4KCF2_9EUKA|nr:hypothetical protein TRFO_24458 [Tritrichomonas foetus]|eukprot:OHT07372.1 hypothetical protein TRFO_24458 [Tritrichomonas foetus]
MTKMLNPDDNIIYIGNVSIECTEDDLYKLFSRFGQIKQIKIFYQIYQNFKYSIGYAFIQFFSKESFQLCIENRLFLSFNKNLLHVHEIKPITKFDYCIFVFFSEYKTTREKIMDFFSNIRPVDVTIRSGVTYDHLGFAIVEFPAQDIREMAVSLAEDSPFQVVLPSVSLVELWASDFNENNISFKPLPLEIYNDDIYHKFMDLEVVHCSTPYRVNSYLASAYSSRIKQLLLSNTLLNRVETILNIDGPFELIQNVLLGQTIEIIPENAMFIFFMAADLGMESLLNDASGHIYSRMTPELAMSIFRDLETIEIPDGPHIRFMAENIDKMRSMKEFLQAPTQLISSVLYHKKLKTHSPEAFCEWLIGFVNQNREDRNRLLQHILVQSLPRTIAINMVMDTSLNINLIRNPLLEFLKRGVEAEKEDDFEVIRCHYEKGNENQGIFATLCKRCNGNPQDFGLVEITCNSNVSNIIEPQENEYWATPDMPNSWVMFDFKNYEIIPTSYTLKSFVADVKLPYMISWRLDGSRDGSKWITLDERRNTTSTADGNKQWRTWKIEKRIRCRFIKLTQIDKNGSGNFCMFLHGIEFFGSLPNQSEDIKYEPGREWSGIFAFITRCEQGNPVEKKKIAITTSCDPKYLMEEKWKGCWRSPKQEFSWVKIDMKAMRIDLRSYSLRWHSGPGYIQSWAVEVSNDDKKWETVDVRRFRREYNEPRKSVTWECSNPFADPVRYIKFTMIDKSQQSEHIFWLSNIELFGDLLRPQ